MSALRVLVSRALNLFGQRHRDEDLAEDIQAHLELLTEEHVRRGLSPEDARTAALRTFGGVEQVKEAYRDQRGLPWVDALMTDLRFGVRLLAKDRSFTLVAVIALALGISVFNTQFSIVNAYCLRGLPIEETNRLVYVATRDARDRERGVSYLDFEDTRAALTNLVGMAAFTNTPVTVADERLAPERFQGTYISANAFRLIGEAPILGRDFRAEDDRPGAPSVVILGSAIWKSRYGGDPGLIGRTIRINGVPSTVIGVMRDGLRFPQRIELWQPLALMSNLDAQKREVRTLGVFGRLANAATLPQATSELNAIATRLAQAFPETNQGIRPTVIPIDERYSARLTHPAWLAFMTVGGLVVLIACANVANLLLMRSTHRCREMAIRSSVGASRNRIIRQLLVESTLLAALGGVVGLGLSFFALRLFVAAIPDVAIPPSGFAMDGRVLAVLATVCFGTVFVFGLVPAIHLSKTDVTDVLKSGGRTVTGGRHARRWTTVFLTAEYALTMILLAHVSLGVVQVNAQLRADAVIDVSRVLTMWVALPNQKYPTPESRIAFHERLKERLGALRDIASFTMASALPFGGGAQRQLEIDGRPLDIGAMAPSVLTLTIDAGYFETMSLPVLRGRGFIDADGTEGRETVIVNERFANMHFPNEEAIGRRIRLTADNAPTTPSAWLTIVGISPNVRQDTGLLPDPVAYLPYRAAPPAIATVIVRGPSDTAAITPLLREEVRALDPDLPLYRIMTMEQAVSESRWNGRVSNAMISIIAFIALTLAGVGVYALTGHAVAQRTHEIGVRLALGAKAGQVRWLILQRAMIQLLIGLAVGLVCTYAWDKIFSNLSLRSGERLTDPSAVIPVLAVLTTVALAACLSPARRATRLDPVAVLRHE